MCMTRPSNQLCSSNRWFPRFVCGFDRHRRFLADTEWLCAVMLQVSHVIDSLLQSLASKARLQPEPADTPAQAAHAQQFIAANWAVLPAVYYQPSVEDAFIDIYQRARTLLLAAQPVVPVDVKKGRTCKCTQHATGRICRCHRGSSLHVMACQLIKVTMTVCQTAPTEVPFCILGALIYPMPAGLCQGQRRKKSLHLCYHILKSGTYP